jgi:hypothetical protein
MLRNMLSFQAEEERGEAAEKASEAVMPDEKVNIDANGNLV